MKKNKFALLAFALLFACSLNAKGNAVQPEHQGIKQPFSGNTAVLSDESD